ncbi:hypothetical protein ABVT39_010353 [Epinephelus coioides]
MVSQKSKNWSATEIQFLIQTLDDLNILIRLDGRKEKNSDLFQQVQERMAEAGLCRTTEQIKNRWKTLKQSYNKAKANNKSGADPSSFPFFEDMNQVLGRRPLATADAHGVDVAFDTEESRGSAEPETESVMDDETSKWEYTANRLNKVFCTGKTTSKSTSGYEKALKTRSVEQKTFMEQMQAAEHRWIEQHEKRHHQREEILVSRFVRSIIHPFQPGPHTPATSMAASSTPISLASLSTTTAAISSPTALSSAPKFSPAARRSTG